MKSDLMLSRSVSDAPGAIHPVITRGINRLWIFQDNAEREIFKDRFVFPGKAQDFVTCGQSGVRRGEQPAHRNRYLLKD